MEAAMLTGGAPRSGLEKRFTMDEVFEDSVQVRARRAGTEAFGRKLAGTVPPR